MQDRNKLQRQRNGKNFFYFQIGTKEYDFHEKLFNEELNLGSNNCVSKLL